MDPQFKNIILFSLIAIFSTIGGSYLVYLNRERAKKYLIYIIAASAGVLLGACFFHLLPEALELNKYALSYSLLALIILYIVEQNVVMHPCDELECDLHKLKLGRMSLIALAAHSLLDGMAIAVGFGINPVVGLVSAIAVILHKIPEGISTFTLLYYGHTPDKKALRLCWIVALATPAGALITYLLLPYFSQFIMGGLMGFAAGSFLYVAAADIIPETHKAGNRWVVLMLLLGVLFIITATKFIPMHAQ